MKGSTLLEKQLLTHEGKDIDRETAVDVMNGRTLIEKQLLTS